MWLLACCQDQLERAAPVVTAFGQAALATTPILVAIATGLLDVSSRNVVVSGTVHRQARWLLYMLAAVAGVWIVADGSKAAGLGDIVCLGPIMVGVAIFQAVASLAAVSLLVYSIARIAALVEASD